MPYDYNLLTVAIADGVATVTIDHPPINLFDMPLMDEIGRIGEQLAADNTVKVIVFQSADPEFFIAHADVELIQTLPTDTPDRPQEISFFHKMLELYRTMPKVSIGKIEGIARGGGSEFLLALDMRFAALGRSVLSQPEVAIGIIPGGGGCVRLPRLIGRGRALEVILGCEDFDAATAERYGYVNRALDPDALGPFVDQLARRIASFPAHAIALAKAAVNSGDALPLEAALLEEEHCFNLSLAEPDARALMETFMANGGQTRAVEIQGIPLPDS